MTSCFPSADLSKSVRGRQGPRQLIANFCDCVSLRCKTDKLTATHLQELTTVLHVEFPACAIIATWRYFGKGFTALMSQNMSMTTISTCLLTGQNVHKYVCCESMRIGSQSTSWISLHLTYNFSQGLSKKQLFQISRSEAFTSDEPWLSQHRYCIPWLFSLGLFRVSLHNL